jgi:uncharacterized membrane protein
MKEKHTRSIIKAITWRIGGTLLTIGLSYLLTHQLDVSFTIGALDLVVKIGGYYLHERLWNKIKYGVEKEQPTELPING